MIRRLKYHEIDFSRYKTCVANSIQRNGYVSTDFLDVLSKKSWELLVYGDYEAVMPVVLQRKAGLKFATRPISLQQLGVFSKLDNGNLNQEFYNFLKRYYPIRFYAFNEKNLITAPDLQEHVNYVIPKASYEQVRKNYHIDRRRNVRILPKNHSKIQFQEAAQPVLLKDFYFNFAKGVSKKDKDVLFRNFIALARTGRMKFYTLKFEENIAAAAIILEDDCEVYALSLLNNPKFNKENCPSILVDKLLQKYVERKDFSFMGSNIPEVATFFKRFGAEKRTYKVISNGKLNFLKSLLAPLYH